MIFLNLNYINRCRNELEYKCIKIPINFCNRNSNYDQWFKRSKEKLKLYLEVLFVRLANHFFKNAVNGPFV